jgi:LPS-assembly protein
MTKLRATLTALLLWASLALAQVTPPGGGPRVDVRSDAGFTQTNGVTTWTSNVVVRFITDDPSSDGMLTADRVSINTNTGDLFADGSVQLQATNQLLIGPHLHFNYLTRLMDWQGFRTGMAPFFAAGESLHGDLGSKTNTATNVVVTTDDYAEPLQKIRARRVTLVAGDYVEARNAVVYLGPVPVFWWPYYHQDLTRSPNRFTFLVGDRGTFGPYLLTTYHWFLNEDLNGALHLDERTKRGFGVGPDLNYNLGQWGAGTIKYYYTHDDDTSQDPFIGLPPSADRQRAYFSYDATPADNLTFKSQVAYQSDPFIIHDFFESEYRQDIQPKTFLEGTKAWPNWSLDGLVQPRINPFFDSMERLPDVRLTGFRQQIFGTPFFYDSETSGGYYQQAFANTNAFTPNYAGTRADTFHQITLPETFFGWLNVTPRAGERFTYYGAATGAGATTTEEKRSVFNTGAEISFKASRLWEKASSSWLDVSGLRHIMEPSMNYVYIPHPNVPPSLLPQYDYQSTNNLELLPLDFPDYNSIDAISNQNTIRFGFGNRLQTKRAGEIDNLVNWQLFMDWHLRPTGNDTTFSDLFSSFELKPRSWLLFDSKTRYDIDTSRFNLAQDQLTFQPNNTWSWSPGHLYVRDSLNFGTNINSFTSTFFYRLNENWGARMQHLIDAETGTLQEQDYTIYRDLRSWTAAVTFRALNNQTSGREYGVAVTFSLKAFPKYGVGQDSLNVSPLLGY